MKLLTILIATLQASKLKAALEKDLVCVYTYSRVHLNTNIITLIYSIDNLVIQSECKYKR